MHLENKKFSVVTIVPKDFEAEYQRLKSFLFEFYDHCPDDLKDNYSIDHWEKNPQSLLNLIYKQKRFSSGYLNLVQDENKIIAMAGCHVYKGNLGLLGVRSCVLPGYEQSHLISTFLLPTQHRLMAQLTKFQIITFNDKPYSLRLMKAFLGRDRWTDRKIKRINSATSGSQNFKLIKDSTFMINNCKQYVVAAGDLTELELTELLSIVG